MALTNKKIESQKEKVWEDDETNDSFNSVNKKVGHSQVEGIDEISVILGSTARDNDCEISNECMKKTWESIHAPSTTDDEKRATMTSQNKRNRSKKMSLTNIILFSVIIGKAFTKKIGGLLAENNLLKGDSHGQFTDARDKEDMNEKAIVDEVIGAYNCLDDSMPSTKISLNPPQECKIEDGSAYKKPTKK